MLITMLRGSALPRAAGVLAAFSLGGCDLLDVELPNVIPPERLEGEAGIQALYGGAVGQFAEIWSGGGSLPGRVLISGLLSDEFESTANLEQFWDLDRRQTKSDQFLMAWEFTSLHRARFALEDAAARLPGLQSDPAADPRIGEVMALAGYTYVALAEDYCAGITVSDFPESGTPSFGPPLMPEEVLGVALERFETSLQWTAGDGQIESLARLGKARALLNLALYAEAAGEAALVAEGFSYMTEHGDATFRLPNSVYFMGQVTRRWSVADGEAVNGLPYRTAADRGCPWRLYRLWGTTGFRTTTHTSATRVPRIPS